MLGFIIGHKKDDQAALLEEISQYKQVLDNIENMVMLADPTPENKIFFMNKAAKRTLSHFRSEFNARFRPGVDVENAFQNSIHQFHKDPDRIRRVFNDMANRKIDRHDALIPIAGVQLQTSVYPIWSAKDPNKVLCFMAFFMDVTAKLDGEKRAVEDKQRRSYLEERVGEISHNMQAMSATIENVAVQTASASESAEVMLRETKSGAAIVDDTSKSMKNVATMVRSTADSLVSLGSRSETIGQIVNVIKDIADQTNLLALNAAIEAARAGETGRGFAVVADEVRKLAERTTKATQEIGTMIRDIQQEVQQNVTAIELGRQQVQATETEFQRAEAALEKIVKEINQMRDFVVQIAEASEEQAATSQDMSDKLSSILQEK